MSNLGILFDLVCLRIRALLFISRSKFIRAIRSVIEIKINLNLIGWKNWVMCTQLKIF